jgi:diguanylate cyclase (GGDEF)-like protein/PAS domain S-box-containing protein
MKGRSRVMEPIKTKIPFVALDQSASVAMQSWAPAEVLAMLTQNLGSTVAIIGTDLRFIYANASFARWFGLTPEQIVGRLATDIYSENSLARYMPYVEQALAGETVRYQRKVHGPVGADEWHTICLTPCHNAEGAIIGITTSALGVQSLQVATEALRTANQRLSFHMDNSPLAVIEMDNLFRIIHCSGRATDLFGWPVNQVQGLSVLELLSADGILQTPLRAALNRLCHHEESRNQSKTTHQRSDGSTAHCDWFNSALTDAQGQVMSIMSLVEDVTTQVQTEHQLLDQAERDPLTKLYNRNAFQTRLDEALARARRSGATVAVMFIDLDGFKHVNDAFGHQTGDATLCDVSKRLLSAVRETDIVARLGGDEFVILLDTEVQPGTTELLGRRILNVLATPFMIKEVPTHISASIGVAERMPTDTSASNLINRADEAMYEAKRAGKARVHHA